MGDCSCIMRPHLSSSHTSSTPTSVFLLPQSSSNNVLHTSSRDLDKYCSVAALYDNGIIVGSIQVMGNIHGHE